jgi:hypothetical protein
MTKVLIAALATLTLADAAPNLTGTWVMGLQAGHVVPVALVLTQNGQTLTGSIDMPTQHVGERKAVDLTGEFSAGMLKLSGAVEGAAEPTTIEIEGKLLDDGSLEGTFAMVTKQTHRATWTAERLKERKP